jgi:hypothetical protein
MLTEARARMVDVETGERPRAMRPLEEDPPPAVASERPARRAAKNEAPKRSPEHTAEKRGLDVKPPAEHDIPAANGEPMPVGDGEHPPIAHPDPGASPPGSDDVLWLEDSPEDGSTPADEIDGDARSHPWRRGLRG